MTTLALAFHHAPETVAALRVANPGVEIRGLLIPGKSSVYHARAAQLRDKDGRLLPALCEALGLHQPGVHDRIVLVSWSAGYAMVEELLDNDDDAAFIDGWVALDSGYGTPTDGVDSLSIRAALSPTDEHEPQAYFASYTDIVPPGYPSTRDFLRALGPPSGLFDVEHIPGDDADAHIRALHRGPERLRACLAALADARGPATPHGDGFSFDAAGDAMPHLDLPEIDATLRPGDDGPHVTHLQALLDAVGSEPRIGAGHTAYGPLTTKSVRFARVAFGFAAADDAPPDFVAALERAVAELPPKDDPGPPIASHEPPPSASLSPLRAAIVATALRYVGVHEHPAGSNLGEDINRWEAACVRNGKRPGFRGVEWCSAFATGCVWEAWGTARGVIQWSVFALPWRADRDGETVPFTLRISVAEMCLDAHRCGRLHPIGDGYAPQLGDVPVYGRGGESPMPVLAHGEWVLGGHGHAGILVAHTQIISGNDGNEVRTGPADRSAKGESLLAWIEVERDAQAIVTPCPSCNGTGLARDTIPTATRRICAACNGTGRAPAIVTPWTPALGIVPRVRTPILDADLRSLLASCLDTDEQARVPMLFAILGVEHGAGDDAHAPPLGRCGWHVWNHNFGNANEGDGDLGRFRIDAAETIAGARRVMHETGPAWSSAEVGMRGWFDRMRTRYPEAWGTTAFCVPMAYALAAKNKGYFTADANDYAAGIAAWLRIYRARWLA